jgi:hypothetical protein
MTKPLIHLDPEINAIILDIISKTLKIDRHKFEDYDLLDDREKRLYGQEAKIYYELNFNPEDFIEPKGRPHFIMSKKCKDMDLPLFIKMDHCNISCCYEHRNQSKA